MNENEATMDVIYTEFLTRQLEDYGKKNMNRPTPELDKLEAYLKEHNDPYERFDEEPTRTRHLDRHQIIVYNAEHIRLWDAICHYGSYGVEQGLIEIYGILSGGSEEGWLTADDVIERWERFCERLERGEGIQ